MSLHNKKERSNVQSVILKKKKKCLIGQVRKAEQRSPESLKIVALHLLLLVVRLLLVPLLAVSHFLQPRLQSTSMLRDQRRALISPNTLHNLNHNVNVNHNHNPRTLRPSLVLPPPKPPRAPPQIFRLPLALFQTPRPPQILLQIILRPQILPLPPVPSRIILPPLVPLVPLRNSLSMLLVLRRQAQAQAPVPSPVNRELFAHCPKPEPETLFVVSAVVPLSTCKDTHAPRRERLLSGLSLWTVIRTRT